MPPPSRPKESSPSAPSTSAWASKGRTPYDLSPLELNTWLIDQGQPAYRAKQVFQALYEKGQEDPASWTVLPKPLRDQFALEFPKQEFSLIQKQTSSDGTVKWLWKIRDGQSVETVMIPSDDRRTVCVSTQVGCAYKCGFCASGLKGFLRDLTAGEIVQQVVQADRSLKPGRVSNIVFMGMGEPLSNYDNLLRAIRIINSPDGLHIGARKITISTVGLVPMMERLGGEGLQLELAISLHAPNDAIRGKLMPVNKKYSMVPLLTACKKYVKATKRLLTFEYILIDGLNDQPEHAIELAGRLKSILCKVNLIPCHPIPGTPWGRPPQERMLAFEKTLKEKGIVATLRTSRGLDIDGACGQLRLHHQENEIAKAEQEIKKGNVVPWSEVKRRHDLR